MPTIRDPDRSKPLSDGTDAFAAPPEQAVVEHALRTVLERLKPKPPKPARKKDRPGPQVRA
jgi:hypothetical protein